MHGETLAGKDGATMAALKELAVLTWVARFVICVSVNAVVCEAKSSGSGMWERLLGTETMEAGRDSGPGKRPQGPVPPPPSPGREAIGIGGAWALRGSSMCDCPLKKNNSDTEGQDGFFLRSHLLGLRVHSASPEH